jgi:UPF0755 protein
MPAKSALMAAVPPASTPALYFVAKGDGSSHFARLVRHVDRVTATHRENQQTLLLVYQP